MIPAPEQAQLPGNIRSLLDQHAAQLPQQTMQRLAAARGRAVEHALQDRHRKECRSGWFSATISASGLAAAFAVALWIFQPADHNGPAINDWDIAATNEELELRENWEFYEWLDSLEQSRITTREGRFA